MATEKLVFQNEIPTNYYDERVDILKSLLTNMNSLPLWLVSDIGNVIVCPKCNYLNKVTIGQIIKLADMTLVDTKCGRCGERLLFVARPTNEVKINEKVGYFEDSRRIYKKATYKKLVYTKSENYIVDTVTFIDVLDLNRSRIYLKYKRPKSKKWKYDHINASHTDIADAIRELFPEKIVYHIETPHVDGIRSTYGITYRGKFLPLKLTDSQKDRLRELLPTLKERSYQITAKELVTVVLGKRYVKSSKVNNFPYKDIADMILLYAWFVDVDGEPFVELAKMFHNPHELANVLFLTLALNLRLKYTVNIGMFLKRLGYSTGSVRKLLQNIFTLPGTRDEFITERIKNLHTLLSKRFKMYITMNRLGGKTIHHDNRSYIVDTAGMLYQVLSEIDAIPQDVVESVMNGVHVTVPKQLHDAVTKLYMFINDPMKHDKAFDYSNIFKYDNIEQLMYALYVPAPDEKGIGIRLLPTVKELYVHANNMNNCSYHRKSFNGKKYVLMALVDYRNEDVGTLQVRFKKVNGRVQYQIDEVKKKNNRPLTKEELEYVRRAIEKAIEQLPQYGVEVK